METTTNLALPYIMPSQAQKHVTHNEALRMLDALVQFAVASRTQNTPPPAPQDGERHIVAAAATGAWQGWDGDLACRSDGAWMRLSPRTGWLAWVEDEARLLVRTGADWRPPEQGTIAELDGLGIRTSPDAANRLAVKSDAVLFSHDDHTPGTGDVRVTLNRSGQTRDAGFVFQNAWSTRALFGLLADDDFHIKVSPDGTSFHHALTIASTSGTVTVGASCLPGADDAYSLGSATRRWKVVHAATGTISTSDARLKEALGPVPVGLAFVRALEPASYRRKDGRRTHFGLVAQQVKAALEAHGIDDFAGWTLADRSDKTSRQGLRYDQFVPILVRAVQELAAEVDALRDRYQRE